MTDGTLCTNRVDLGKRLIIKIKNGNKVEVAQVAGRDIVAATTWRTHCSAEYHIHNVAGEED